MKTFKQFLNEYLLPEEVVPFPHKSFNVGDEVKIHKPGHSMHGKVGHISHTSHIDMIPGSHNPQRESHMVLFNGLNPDEKTHHTDIFHRSNLMKTGKKFFD